MPLNGLRIAQAYNTSPSVSGDSFAPSPFPDAQTQLDIQAGAVATGAVNSLAQVNAALAAVATVATLPDDGVGPNTIYLNVTPTITGLKIFWNGLDTNGAQMPPDFAYVEVYVSSAGGFVPSSATRLGRLYKAGEMYYFSNGVYQRFYVVGLATDRAGNVSPYSNQISDTPRQILGSDITANTITANNILAGSISADRIATGFIFAGVKITVGSLTNNTARIEIDQQHGINLISRDNSGVDTNTVSLDTTSGVGFITGGVITGTSISTALAPSSRIELKGGGVGVRDTLSFYPGSGVAGESPAILTTATAFGRQQLTLRSPFDGTGTQPCSILFQSSVDGTTSGTNGPVMTLTSGTIQVSGDLQINSQSVARGLISFTSSPGQTNVAGTAGGGEIAVLWFAVGRTIEQGRKYRLRWRGTLSRSDSAGEIIIVKIRGNNGPTFGATTTGSIMSNQYQVLGPSYIGAYFVAEVVILGTAAGGVANPNPQINEYFSVPAGLWDFSLTIQKNSGAGTAGLGCTGNQFTLEDIGT